MKDWLLLVVAAVLNGAGSLLLKQSRLGIDPNAGWERWLSPWLFAGIGCYGINVLVFAKALEALNVSVAYPVLAGLSFALISLGAAYYFKENFGWMQWIGLMLVLVGIILLAQTQLGRR